MQYTEVMAQIAGLLGALTVPLCFTETVVWPPADRPISSELVEEVLDNVRVETCYLAPSLLEEMSQSQASLEKLAKFKHVKFGGGETFFNRTLLFRKR